jgi:hypothetical protein
MNQPESEKKIHVDEDWKGRVEAEKRGAGQPEEPAVETAGGSEAAANDVPMPPADLSFLAGTLYMQAMIGLGLVLNPVSGKSHVSLPHAKHGIDTLDMLQQKTQGNRTPGESQLFESMLHELRMAYVAVLESPPPPPKA